MAGVIGDKPSDPWFRPERRGYDVEFIAHDDLAKTTSWTLVTRAVMRSRKWDGRGKQEQLMAVDVVMPQMGESIFEGCPCTKMV